MNYNLEMIKQSINVVIPDKCVLCSYMFEYKCQASECDKNKSKPGNITVLQTFSENGDNTVSISLSDNFSVYEKTVSNNHLKDSMCCSKYFLSSYH